MEKNNDEASIQRNAARGAKRSALEAQRQGMAVIRGATLKNPHGRFAKRMSPVMLDMDIFEDWLKEKGGVEPEGREERFMLWFCAQVASGVTSRALCSHYCVADGILGSFLSEKPERIEQYQRAQQWAAEGLVEDGLEAVWSDGPDVVRDKLAAEFSLKVAGKWNRPKYGEEKQQGVPGVPIINFIMPPALPREVPVLTVEQVNGIFQGESHEQARE